MGKRGVRIKPFLKKKIFLISQFVYVFQSGPFYVNKKVVAQ